MRIYVYICLYVLFILANFIYKYAYGMLMVGKDTSIRVTKATRDELNEYRDELEKKLGATLTLDQAITHLLKKWG